MFKGFPLRKVPFYILSQLLGGFLAALCVYGIFSQQLKEVTAALEVVAPAQIFTPQGVSIRSTVSSKRLLLTDCLQPAGIFALFPGVGQELRWAFFNEFLGNMFLSILVFSVLDLCK